jgi:hypothetical protein
MQCVQYLIDSDNNIYGSELFCKEVKFDYNNYINIGMPLEMPKISQVVLDRLEQIQRTKFSPDHRVCYSMDTPGLTMPISFFFAKNNAITIDTRLQPFLGNDHPRMSSYYHFEITPDNVHNFLLALGPKSNIFAARENTLLQKVTDDVLFADLAKYLGFKAVS